MVPELVPCRSQLALRIILVVTALVGVWLRFDGIGRWPFWYDEVATLLHLSGRTEVQLGRLYDGRILRGSELLATYQGGAGSLGEQPLVRLSGSVADVLRAVAADEPQSGALYFAVASAVTVGPGDPVRVRAVSAVASTASLLLLGLLAWRLFDQGTALAAVALAAISPLELRFAHEARPYALCAAFLLASALSAHRASCVRDLPSWFLYALCLTAALWTHPIALLALPALLALASASVPDRYEFSSTGGGGAAWLATSVAMILWLPWALVCWIAYPKIQQLTAWSSEPIGVEGLARGWLGAITSFFFRPRGEGGILPSGMPELASSSLSVALAGVAVVIVAAALRSMTQYPNRSTRHYVLVLALAPWLVLAALDLALGGRRSTVARYLIPTWAGTALAVAYWLMQSGLRRRYRCLLLVLLLILGGATAWQTRAARGWWDTDVPRLHGLQEAAAAIDAVPGAFVVTDMAPLLLLEMARYLHPDTSFRLGLNAAASLDDEWPRVVLVAPTPSLFEAMRKRAGESGARLERWWVADTGPDLWRVVAVPLAGASRPPHDSRLLDARRETDARESTTPVGGARFRGDPDHHGQADIVVAPLRQDRI